ncbi:MAG: hypothetical protein HYY08_00805 [Firmicutes bacterium]|nr:hypothetical protein [Bacillota bacterium]
MAAAILLTAGGLLYVSLRPGEFPIIVPRSAEPRATPSYFIIVDQRDKSFLTWVGVEVHVGDSLVISGDRTYLVTVVRSNVAEARLLSPEEAQGLRARMRS